MKRLLIIIIALLMLTAAGCGTNGELNVETNPPVSPSPTCEEIIQAVSSGDWAPVTLEKMAVSIDTIIVGKVKEVLPAVRVNLTEYGYETSSDREEWANITRCRVEVLTSVKGELAQGETINADQRGGFAECINEYTENLPFLEEGSTYILFLYEPEFGKDAPYCKYMTGTLQSFLEVVDGKMLKQDYNFFEEETPVEEAVEKIKAVMIPVLPKNIPLEEAIDTLSQWLEVYDEQFKPSARMTDEELARIYDFEGVEFVEKIVGLKLEIGYMVIWIKTSQLDRNQQEEFRAELGSAADRIADEMEIHSKVSCSAFDTLITIIGASEDNASVHTEYLKMITED